MFGGAVRPEPLNSYPVSSQNPTRTEVTAQFKTVLTVQFSTDSTSAMAGYSIQQLAKLFQGA